MISEQLTVTTTPTSIRQLIANARNVAVGTIANKCVGIMLRYARAETAMITLSDAKSASGAVILDAATDILLATTFRQFNNSLALLSSSSGSITVHMIIEQTLI